MEKYRKILVIQEGHDFSALNQYTGEVVFITDGSESVREAAEKIDKALEDFDPTQDALVPVGKTTSVLFMGMQLGRRFQQTSVYIGLHRTRMIPEREYQWISTNL